MKKLFALGMILIMVLSCFAGCGNPRPNEDDMLGYVSDVGQTANDGASDNDDGKSVSDESFSDSDMAYILGKGTLIVGITDYAPMDFKDENGEWTGFDAEFARIFGEKLGVEVVFQEIQWSSKFFELEGKTIDCIWNGMTITEERQVNMSITIPYMENKQVMVTK